MDDFEYSSSETNAASDCAWVRANASSYVLGSLDTNDSDSVATHLMLCPGCDSAVRQLEPTVSLLGLASANQIPSPDLKIRLMSAVAAEPRSARAVDALRLPSQTNVKRPWFHASRLTTAALLSLVLLLAGWGIYAQNRMADQDDRVTELSRSNEAMAVHLGSLQAGEVAFGANSSSFQLMSVSDAANDAGGILVTGTGERTTVFSVWNMPTEHDTYHVICESERGELLAAGEITVNSSGNGTVTITLPSPVTDYRAVHVLPTSSTGEAAADLLTHDILQALLSEPETHPAISD